ncbi:MAG: PEP-CTERM sorting domain-containing protein [Fimbriimonadales bacterium]
MATMIVEAAPGGFYGGGQFFEGNTGDHALLLNDGAIVGSLIDGGTLVYTFQGIDEGKYEIFSYAVSPLGVKIETPVYVPEAVENRLQIVTGPMPGNAFEYLITHSAHRVDLSATSSFHIIFEQLPGEPTSQWVNGFQIVPIPEPGTASVLLAALFVFILLRKCRPLNCAS